MTSSLDRRLEKAYIARNIELTETGFNIPFDYTWISNLSSNKKLGVRRIAAGIDFSGDYPFRLEVDHNVLQGCMTYIAIIQSNFNITTQMMSNIGQIITDRSRSILMLI
jgi:hypothetical protein